jgi:Fic family protein
MKKKLNTQAFFKGLEASLLIGSTLVEGSTLSEGQAKQVLQGQTITGHPVHEHRELLNYQHAVQWIVRELQKTPYLSEDLIFRFHERLFMGFSVIAGRYKTHKNYCLTETGQKHWYADPSIVALKMKEWIQHFNLSIKRKPLLAKKCATLYNDFEQIHPFEDGNGRIGRIFIAIYAYFHFTVRFTFFAKDRLRHLRVMQSANKGDIRALTLFIQERLK